MRRSAILDRNSCNTAACHRSPSHLLLYPHPSSNTMSATTHQKTPAAAVSTQKKRKLALVKCERCRLDKQKCLPVERTWPEKCDRCTAKDFECSEGQRVHRKSKHSTITPSDQPVATNLSTSIPNSSSNDLLEKLRLRRDLMSYQDMFNMAMRCLKQLKTELISPFVNTYDDDGVDFEDIFSRTACGRFETFLDALESKIHNITLNLLTTNASPTSALSATIVQELIGQTTPRIAWQAECSICHGKEDQVYIPYLKATNHICGEYLLRLDRLAQHFNEREHWNDIENFEELLEDELFLIWDLMIKIKFKIKTDMKSIDLDKMMPDILQSFWCFVPTDMVRPMASIHMFITDCLGRTGLHQCLDTIQVPNDEDERLLSDMIWKNGAPDEALINEWDILGRTALHIACHNGWISIAQILIRNHADIMLRTVCGSLPLHYAASNGSVAICEMLLSSHSVFSTLAVSRLEDDNGGDPLYYAIVKKSWEVIRCFVKQHYPVALRHVSLAVVSDDIVLLQMLLKGSSAMYTELRDLLIGGRLVKNPAMWSLINSHYGYQYTDGPVWLPPSESY
ncbi:unnamed protein product [Periconia digitata]|uniref:Uncharacterized protein n=1 Tax=Periconia digitata TaxID=1303443 RepID=A0A9W4UD11_9PLEO|nr:unnamed protein product [Periconia digitata]